MPAPRESKVSIKKAASQLIRQLPDSASWDDLMYEILVRQKIEVGLTDLQEGRTHDHASIRAEFGFA
jgi:Tfp pilus assembly protein PilO